MSRPFTFASLAAGAGLGSYGFSLAGGTCVATVEKDAGRRRCLGHHYPNAKHLVDLRTVKGRMIGEVDVMFITTPCPSFSAGNRKAAGLNDQRGNLLFEAFRIADEARPNVIVLENVPALLHSNHEIDVQAGLDLPEMMGYKLVFQEQLDARRFGVPQSRKRLFFVWVRGDIGIGTLQPLSMGPLVTVNSIPERWLGPEVAYGALLALRDRINRHGKPGFAHLADAFIGDAEEPEKWRGFPIFHCNHSNSAFGVGCMVTLTKSGRAMVRWNGRVHKLSVEAWEELMGLPAGFTEPIGSHAQRREACGDGVVTHVAESVGNWINELLAS